MINIEQIKKNIKNGIEMFDNEAIRRNIEIWRTIVDYPNYEVSSFGNVRNVTTGRILKLGKNTHGYYDVILSNAGKRKHYTVHRLVANAFIENMNGKNCVDHINNNKTDNKVTNLRFATNQENNFNRSMRSDNISGAKGVTWQKKTNKWRAYIKFNNKYIHIGVYKTIEEATVARQLEAKELFGEYVNNCDQDENESLYESDWDSQSEQEEGVHIDNW